MTIVPGETVADRVKRLSQDLIGVKSQPGGYDVMRAQAVEARAYHEGQPYPWFHFQDWKIEDRGPLPRCLPFVRRTVRKGAKWLFGKPIQITVPGNEQLEEFLRSMWMKNRMGTRMVAAATRAGYQGGLLLKWSYDETDDVPLRFQILSTIDECRLFYDPQDKDRLLMLRVQYPYFDETQRRWFWYREEWTDELEVHYKPLMDERLGQQSNIGGFNPYNPPSIQPDKADWELLSMDDNPFGIIPAQPIRNIETENSWGNGDFWGGGMLRTVDRVNLTFHLMDKSNQFDAEPNKIFIDLMADQDDLDGTLAPAQNLSLKTDNGGDGEIKQGKVEILEAKGNLRPAMMEYAKELKMELLDSIGCVDVRPDEVTNKGNLTSAVLTQLYLPLIEATDEKRKTYGEDGICKFLEKCAIGLAFYGEVKEIGKVSKENEESHDVQIGWAPYFKPTSEEKMNETTNAVAQVANGFITREKAVERIAAMEGIEDVKAMADELEEKHKQMEDADQANTDALIKAAETAGQDGNDD